MVKKDVDGTTNVCLIGGCLELLEGVLKWSGWFCTWVSINDRGAIKEKNWCLFKNMG